MARTFPSKGVAPIDAYDDKAVRSLGYFEGISRKKTSGTYRSVEVISTYQPAGDSGYTTIMGLSSKVQLGASASFTGGTGYLWGIQAQLDLLDGATLDNTNSVFAAGRFVMTKSGTPIFTAIEGISNIYCDNLIATNMAGITGGKSSFIHLHNAGGTMDTAFRVWGGNKIPVLFRFDACGSMVAAGAAKAGTSANISVDWEGTTYYINMKQV